MTQANLSVRLATRLSTFKPAVGTPENALFSIIAIASRTDRRQQSVRSSVTPSTSG